MPLSIQPGQLQRNPLTGKLQRDPTTGKIRRTGASSSICCCRSTCKCGTSGTSAFGDQLTLIIDGVTPPTGCLSANFFAQCAGLSAGMAYRFTTFPINGTFCLTKEPDSCSWSVIVPVAVDVWFGTGVTICSDYGGGLHETYTQLKITASEVYSPGVGGQMRVIASVIDASAVWFSTVRSVPLWDGFDPFANIIVSNYDTLDCGGTVTLSNTGIALNSHLSTWFSEYENVQFILDDCEIGFVRNSWVSGNPPPEPIGTPWGGALILADAPC